MGEHRQDGHTGVRADRQAGRSRVDRNAGRLETWGERILNWKENPSLPVRMNAAWMRIFGWDSGMSGNFEEKEQPAQEVDPADREQFWQEIADLLQKMLVLAERSAEDTCSDEERAALQKNFRELQRRVNFMWTGYV